VPLKLIKTVTSTTEYVLYVQSPLCPNEVL
jgi:hypothetical protein